MLSSHPLHYFWRAALLGALLLLALPPAVQGEPRILYVASGAAGAGDGSSWQDAYRNPQDALAIAQPGDQIWIAQGVYTPGGERGDTFRLPNGVALYGGFRGDEMPQSPTGEPPPRDWLAHPTILSGDLLGNDSGPVATEEPSRAENSYHVLTAISVDGSTRLDGLIIRSGNANGYHPDSAGAGLYLAGGNPTIANCLFEANAAAFGGGIACYSGAAPLVSHCIFRRNVGWWAGGGLYSRDSEPVVQGSLFEENRTTAAGGGMACYGGTQPTVTDSVFRNNRATAGAGLACEENAPWVMDSTFHGNTAYEGGAIRSLNSNLVLVSSALVDNAADVHGGAIQSLGHSQPLVINCLLAGNRALRGGAISSSQRAGPLVINSALAGNVASTYGGGIFGSGAAETMAIQCTLGGNRAPQGSAVAALDYHRLTVRQSIVWGGTGAQTAHDTTATITVTHSLVQGGYAGEGNLLADPRFIRPPSAGPDGLWATSDDDAGDLCLYPRSPAIDAGQLALLPADLADLDADGDIAEPLPFDLAGNPRLRGPAPDLGAYEMPPHEILALPLIVVSHF